MSTRKRKFHNKKRKGKKKQRSKMVRVDFFKSKIIPRWPNGFSPKLTTTLRYCQTISLNPGAGSTARHTFRANSIFDPDVTGVGHQPLYHDTLYQVYQFATVMGSRMTVQWTPNTVANVNPGALVLFKAITAGQLDTFSFANVMEQSVIGIQQYSLLGLLNARNQNKLVLSINYSPKKDLNYEDPIDEEDLRQPNDANPVTEYFYDILYMATDDLSDPGLVDLFVTIEYLCEFNTLNGQSSN